MCVDTSMDPAMAIEAAALAQQQPMLDALAQGDSEVQRFYKNCAVFITGGTGFLGKQLIEKLFRCCHISKVYILTRSKKGKGIQERIQELFKDPVFDTLYKQQPDFKEKVIAVEGDVSELRLGIKDTDWKILTDEVEVIFHVAATTRFDEPLRVATLINIRGTREALLLGQSCKKLKSFVHVSTAYSHATTHHMGGEVQEEFYPSPVPPEVMISMAENMEVDRLNNITIHLIKNWPNTYTFTKAIAEELIRTSSDGLPICIVRPSIVLSTYREPSPGWLDKSCLFGFVGLVFGGGIGVLHAAHIDCNIRMDYIPCDYVNNAAIVAAREAATNQAKGGNDTKIYNVCSTHRNPVKFDLVRETLETIGRSIMSPKSVYYGFSIYTINKYWFKFLALFLQIIPAYIADFVCFLMGKERRFSKLSNKVCNAFSVVSFFSLNEWIFVDNNLEKLYSGLSEQDKAIFDFDVKKINWTEMILILCIGLRKYIVKDGLKDTAYGIKKQKYMRIGHYIFMTLYIYSIWKLITFAYYLGSSLFATIFYLHA